MRTCAGKFADYKNSFSDTAVKKRLMACVPWVKAMLSKVFGLAHVVESGHLRFIVIDGSTVQVPGADGTSYRLHIAIDLVSLELLQVKVTDEKQGEGLDHYVLKNGDVVVIDRGYNQPKQLMPFIDQGGDILLRYNPHGMKVFYQNDEMVAVDWEKELRKFNDQAGVIPVYLCYQNKRVAAWVHMIPLPQEQASRARQRVQKNAKKRGGTPKAKTLYIAGWVLVLTTLPVAVLKTQTAAALYRVRWQVELVIKRLKSLLDIDLLRARKDSELSELYLHGKLLYAVVIERITHKRFPEYSPGMIPQRTHTPWRLWKLIAAEVKGWLSACFPSQEGHQGDCIKAITERPRKRKLQTLPQAIFDLIDHCHELNVSAC